MEIVRIAAGIALGLLIFVCALFVISWIETSIHNHRVRKLNRWYYTRRDRDED